jgi:hypothetical protein
MADIMRVNEDEIRHQGPGNNTTMRAYLTILQREMMQSMESFPVNGGSFYLARAALDQPTSLCKKLFPAINEWNGRLTAK